MKIVLACLMIFLFSPAAASADQTGLKSRLDGNDFYSRIRIEADEYRLSLGALLTGGGFEWVEPSFRSVPFIAGRLQPKGIIREALNPDTLNPLSSVLTENGRIAVSDSFSRGSRYGVALMPFDTPDILLWCWMTNAGLVQSGVLVQQVAPDESLLPPWFSIETDFMLTAAETGKDSPSSWFSEHELMPSQLFLLPAAELRFLCGEQRKDGRAMLDNSADSFSVSGSFLGACSLPLYTECGFLYRGYIRAGSSLLSVYGLIEGSEQGYITFSGNAPGFSRIAGAGLELFYDFEGIEIKSALGCTLRLRAAEVIPSRIYAQSDILDAEVGTDFYDLVEISVYGKFKREFEKNGNVSYASSAGSDAVLSFPGYKACFGVDCDIHDSEGHFYPENPRLSFKTDIDLEPLELKFSAEFSGESAGFSAGFELRLSELSLKSSVEIDFGGIEDLVIEVTSM